MVETYKAVVELLDRNAEARRAEEVRAELGEYLGEVVLSERGYLAQFSLRAENLTEAAGTAVVVAQAAAQAPAISIRVSCVVSTE
jgi:hypothetical protein